MINFRLLVFLTGFSLLSQLSIGQVHDTAITVTDSALRALPSVGPEIPQRVLKKIDSLFPNQTIIPEDMSSLGDFSFGTGEPIEHGLPTDYFKGKTFYNYDYSNDNDTNYNIYLDSAGNIMLKEIYVHIDSSNIPRRIHRYLDSYFYKYKIEEESVEEYSSLYATWSYNIYVNNGSHEEPQELFFDSAGIYITSNGIQPPTSISALFEAKYPDAEILNWDTILCSKEDWPQHLFEIRYRIGDIIYNNTFDSIGDIYGYGLQEVFVPYIIRAKAQAICPQWILDDWKNGDMGNGELDKPNRSHYSVIFTDTSFRPSDEDKNFITLDSVGNVIEISHSVRFDSLPVRGKKYINKHYKEYKQEETLIITNSKGLQAYAVSLYKNSDTRVYSGYRIYFNKKGKYLSREPYQFTIGQF